MGRTRVYACIVYPESAPFDWIDILRDSHVPAFISPLHCDDGKKEHYHVMVMYDGVKSSDQFRDLASTFGGVGCEVVQSIRGYARYLCHLDDTDKASYNPADVIALNGSDYLEVIGTSYDKMKCITEMMDFCDQEHITQFSQLLRIARLSQPDWFRCLVDSSYLMKEYIKSLSSELTNL